MNYFMIHNMLRRQRKGRCYSRGDASLVILPVAVLGSLIVAGAELENYYNEEKEKSKPSYGYEQSDDDVRTFEPGEHIISVLIDSPLEEAKQYEYHPGYKPLGIATSTYGKSGKRDAGSCILYVNESEVVAKADGMVDNELHFGEFGIPIDFTEEEQVENEYTVEFEPGEHIISIPISDPTDYNVQYTFHDGYEPIGIATAAYGKSTDQYAGGCILYVNVEEVTCQKEDDGIYTSFGTIVEKQNQKVKK